ncbi:hypothetical protein IV487_14340 [Enterococcus saccharolyticus]|uniref:Uncharacterized protein n=1 Tax=Candidatus Enterococcus willemsii TaxID=1857215 RepID=A0ABQ6YVM2_9ENTE|nr:MULTISPECIES: hypothetical protein [Enterococcus]KAF1301198.1 hypothetical protein BAU17_02705 [Enterococcus sp. CU12B]MCD5003642.1 hypothetical protein [Enterococcus saccharolyticus]
MIPFKNVFTEYAIIRGKRFTKKDKINFLAVLKKDFDSFGYPVEVVRKEEKMLGERLNYHNLYAGDLEKAQTVFVTYYDTPILEFNKGKYAPFTVKKPQFLSAFLPTLLLSLLFLMGFYFLLYPHVKDAGLFSVSGGLTFVVFFLWFLLLQRVHLGVPRRENFVRNTSSVLALRHFAALHQGDSRYAFAFVDAGTTNRVGEKMLQQVLKKKTKIVCLDAVIATPETYLFTDQKVTPVENVIIRPKKDLPAWGDILITSGEEQAGKVLVDCNMKVFDLSEMEQRLDDLSDILERIG